jgi:hypothetical protein
MGVDISDWGNFNWAAWRELLELAHSYGWEPAGTVYAERDEGGNLVPVGLYQLLYGCREEDLKPGSYSSNDGQWVTDEDAAALANALSRGLEGHAEN